MSLVFLVFRVGDGFLFLMYNCDNAGKLTVGFGPLEVVGFWCLVESHTFWQLLYILNYKISRQFCP